MQDLAYALRDGVLLCHLLHTIDPTSLDMRLVRILRCCEYSVISAQSAMTNST